MRTRSEPSPSRSPSTGAPDAFGLALVRSAGGDPLLLDALRRLAWERYLAAGAPCGLSEEGMGTWWSERMAAAQN